MPAGRNHFFVLFEGATRTKNAKHFESAYLDTSRLQYKTWRNKKSWILL